MRISRMGTLTGCAVLIFGIAVTAGPVASAAMPHAETFLALSVQSSQQSSNATLRCDPPEGTHPSPAATCTALAVAGGDVTKLEGRPGTMCADIYDPVTAQARGVYNGARVNFRRTYPNRCDLDRETAPVFEF
jgi:Subtilisin inhibitor-like